MWVEGTHSIGRVGRRGAVVVLYLGLAAAAIIAVISDDMKPWPWPLAVLSGLACSIGALMLLIRRTHSWRWATSPRSELDEFERTKRDEARAFSYALGACIGLAGAAMLLFGPDGSALWVVLAWVATMLTLPIAVLAWTEPDSPD